MNNVFFLTVNDVLDTNKRLKKTSYLFLSTVSSAYWVLFHSFSFKHLCLSFSIPIRSHSFQWEFFFPKNVEMVISWDHASQLPIEKERKREREKLMAGVYPFIVVSSQLIFDEQRFFFWELKPWSHLNLGKQPHAETT